MNEEESLEEQLNNLVVETCQHPQGSVERQRGLNKLIRIMQRSGKIWRDSSPDYEDALYQTWLYFCLNLCEAITAKSAYDPSKASLITWFNNHLKWKLFDLRLEEQKKRKIFVDNVTADGIDIVDKIPSPESEQDLWTFVCTWIKNDPDGKFKAEHIRDRPDVNAQVVCLGRLHGKLWRELATELRSSIPVLSGFFQRRCISLLKEIPEIDDFL